MANSFDNSQPKHSFPPPVKPEEKVEEKSIFDSFKSKGRAAKLGLVLALLIPLLVAGTPLALGYYNKREPVRAMQDFLEASRTGDISTAMEYVAFPPRGQSAKLLHPDAVSTMWEVDDVSLLWFSDRSEFTDETASARVEVTIIGPQETEVTSKFMMGQRRGERWYIHHALSSVETNLQTLPYVEANGHRAEIGRSRGDSDNFYVLPGVYEFYSQEMEVFESGIDTKVVLGSRVFSVGEEQIELFNRDRRQTVSLNDDLQLKSTVDEVANARLRSHLTLCVDTTDGPRQEGCPFGTTPDNLRAALNNFSYQDFSDFRWSVLEEPSVEVSMGRSNQPRGDLAIEYDHGLAELIVNADGVDLRFTCQMHLDYLYFHVNENADMAIGSLDDFEEMSADRFPDWDNCVFG
ncbi:hypothetical protein [Natronoglycomyces albus]|uniref:Uncharacterized protein n=1 Tax=Natronoglycomyces albus TaxID=2811108 RepID=A0A895XJS0_9ACTN|nr:hypothetical protein [Natronoglycomyces albus]QSB05257.1 hypothetical protein JQS30_16125 [Natronoglycomyces albus]